MKDEALSLFITNEQRSSMAEAEEKITGTYQHHRYLGRKRDSGEIIDLQVVFGGYMLRFESEEQKSMFIMRYM